MTVAATDLVGGWKLECWSLIYEDGRPPEFPLGPDATGLIIYTLGGQVSATIMRARRDAIAPVTDQEKIDAFDSSFAYAGRYEIRDGTAFHTIDIATNPVLIGMTSTRYIKLEGELLTLSGPDFTGGSRRSQKIEWQRIACNR